jgi:microcompartment protein CcmL/EutN
MACLFATDHVASSASSVEAGTAAASNASNGLLSSAIAPRKRKKKKIVKSQRYSEKRFKETHKNAAKNHFHRPLEN